MTNYNIRFITCSLLIVLLHSNRLCAQQKSQFRELSSTYTMTSTPDKYKASQFLIKQIPFKYYYDGDIIKKFDTIFFILDSLQKKKAISNQDPVLQTKWNSIVDKYGSPIDGKFEIIPDSVTLTKEYLQANIEAAFKVKDEKLWLHSMPDSIFNEYVLPYRIGTERLEPGWRNYLYRSYDNLIKKGNGKQENFEKIKNTEMVAFAGEIQWEIKTRVGTSATMWEYPFDIPISKMEKGKKGACRHLTNYTTAVMRSIGLPVTMDFTIGWGNNRTGHEWNVLITPQNKVLPFDACSYPMGIDLSDRKIVKIYRIQYSLINNFTAPTTTDVPLNIYDPTWKDVTQEYTKTSNIIIDIPKEVPKNKKFALIGTFNNIDWTPQFYAPISKGKAVFSNLGCNNVYIGMFMDNDEIKTYGVPFILDSLGNIHDLTPNISKSDIVLKRKYHRTNAVNFYEQSMIGGKFECSNNPDFSNKVTIFTINDQPDSFESREIKLDKKYQYYRFTLSSTSKPYIAELELYDIKNQYLDYKPLELDSVPEMAKIYDHDLNTYYWGKSNGTITYDLGKPTSISKVKFAPRSDSNFIIEGDKYELNYWNDNKWIPLNTIVATRSDVKFQNVPQTALYLLHNLSRGNEERIFTYENGKQVWW